MTECEESFMSEKEFEIFAKRLKELRSVEGLT